MVRMAAPVAQNLPAKLGSVAEILRAAMVDSGLCRLNAVGRYVAVP
jgi:hypothetical protein